MRVDKLDRFLVTLSYEVLNYARPNRLALLVLLCLDGRRCLSRVARGGAEKARRSSERTLEVVNSGLVQDVKLDNLGSTGDGQSLTASDLTNGDSPWTRRDL